MKKPLKPLPTDCCGSGCLRCVYEIYDEQLEKYLNWKKTVQKEGNAQANGNNRMEINQS